MIMNLKKQAAFLRGVNVSGHKPVKMDELKRIFVSLGFKNVKTILNSGNVIFETDKINDASLSEKIELALLKKLNLKTGVIIRDFESLKIIADSGQFRDIVITPQIRLYVTFLKKKNSSKKKLSLESANNEFKIIKITDYDILSVLNLSEGFGTVDFMKILEKEFGKEITTRNMNTIIRILKN